MSKRHDMSAVIGQCVELILKASLGKGTIDNVTVVIVCFRNIVRHKHKAIEKAKHDSTDNPVKKYLQQSTDNFDLKGLADLDK